MDVCNGFPDHYRQTLSIPLNDERRIQNELHRFSIARTTFSTEDFRPYIPGSSVKGALRTGRLNELQQKKHLPVCRAGKPKSWKDGCWIMTRFPRIPSGWSRCPILGQSERSVQRSSMPSTEEETLKILRSRARSNFGSDTSRRRIRGLNHGGRASCQRWR